MVIECFGRVPGNEKAQARRASRELERRLAQWDKPFKQAIKILLLGAGEAGKTTIIKQMKILHIAGFSDNERVEQIAEVRRNVHEAISSLCANLQQLRPPIKLRDPELESCVALVQQPQIPYSQEFYDATERLWRDEGIQECFQRSNEFQLNDCAKYYLDRLETVRRDNYIPTDQDILHCRSKSTGIQKVEFPVKVPRSFGGGIQQFWMFDVGGQRGERRRWIQAFDGIHAVLFLVASSAFDQTIREDQSTNRLQEALDLFEQVWDSRYLRSTGFILFFNKQDVLERKIKAGRNIADYYPAYQHYEFKNGETGGEFEKARAFIRDLFLDLSRRDSPCVAERTLSMSAVQPSSASGSMRRRELRPRVSMGTIPIPMPSPPPSRPRECYWHYTTAVDTNNVKTVFQDVHSMVITWNLAELGLQ